MPPSIREAVLDLLDNRLWQEICRVLYNTPINMRMNQSKLIEHLEAFIEENRIDYLQLNEELKALEEKGYLHIEERSMPDYFLTPLAVEAIEVVSLIENKVVLSLSKEFKKDRHLKRADVEKRVRQDMRSFLK
jgi:DNA-binding HxlR family transcriptional regulator